MSTLLHEAWVKYDHSRDEQDFNAVVKGIFLGRFNKEIA